MYGLVFLFKYTGNPDQRAGTVQPYTSNVFFSQQVIQNACATIAILNILLNTEDVDLGPHLSDFKAFTADFTPDLKGLAISNSELIRSTHNSFAKSDPFVNDGPATDDDDKDLFHFVAYLPVNGVLYELDGLREGPISHGTCTSEDWLNKVHPVIAARIASYGSEIRFNLMALVKNRSEVYEQQLKEMDEKLTHDPTNVRLFLFFTRIIPPADNLFEL